MIKDLFSILVKTNISRSLKNASRADWSRQLYPSRDTCLDVKSNIKIESIVLQEAAVVDISKNVIKDF
jgi:hypothetical protein